MFRYYFYRARRVSVALTLGAAENAAGYACLTVACSIRMRLAFARDEIPRSQSAREDTPAL